MNNDSWQNNATLMISSNQSDQLSAGGQLRKKREESEGNIDAKFLNNYG